MAVLVQRLVLSGGSWSRKGRLGPRGKIRRLLAGDLVGQRDRITRIRAEIRVRVEVGENWRDVFGAGEPAGNNVPRDLLERELVTLSIQGGDNLVEAQEIADQRQMFTVPRKIRLRECTGHDAADFSDVAHMDDALLGIKRQRPTRGTVRLFLRSHCAE